MEESKQYEEYRNVGTVLGWVILLVFTASILGWGMFMMMMIMDAPRHWDHGQLDDTPASSVFSSVEPDTHKPAPLQIQPVPGSVPIETVPHGPYSPPQPKERVPQL